jgi:hypothetical protein
MSDYQQWSASPANTPGPKGTVVFDVAYPQHLSRLLIFVKWLLAIPHFFILYFLNIAVGVVSIIAWFAILFTGRYPRGMWDFVLLYERWTMNVTVYAYLLQDEYPPFGEGPYPVGLDLEYPERLSRLLIFVKWLLVIPHLFILAFLGLAAGLVSFIGFFAILITGNYPRSMFDFMVGFARWSLRVNLYLLNLTDVYPPFSLE